MQFFNASFARIYFLLVLCASGIAHAEGVSGTFGVTIVLRTFSEAVTAEHRCISRGQGDGNNSSMRISCPATVDVQAVASAALGQAGKRQRMNASPEQLARSQLMMVAGQPVTSSEPIELTISW